MNKYRDQSAAKLWRSCKSKAAFATKEAAFHPSQSPYCCAHCGQWHRVSGLDHAPKKRQPKRTTAQNRRAT